MRLVAFFKTTSNMVLDKSKRLFLFILRKKFVVAFFIFALLLIVAIGVPLYSGPDQSFKAGKYQVKVELVSHNFKKGKNELILIISDKDGLLTEANVRGKVYNKDMTKQTAVNVTIKEKGVYHSIIDLPEKGEWIFAADIDSEELGHGDLVFSLETGKENLSLLSATSEGIDYYTCSMHSSVKLAVDGSCPICGMNLVPVMKQSKENLGIISLSGKKRQLIGVTTTKVKKEAFTKTIRAAGKITYDESRLTEITLKYDAWVEELNVFDIGQSVKVGDALFNIYSPELISAQQEYLAASSGSREYKLAAAEKLKLWGVNTKQLKDIQKKGKIFYKLAVYSPAQGVVVSKNIIQGVVVKSGKPLLRIADLSKVWLEAFVYQSDLSWVKEGVRVEILVDDLPGHKWISAIKHLDPFIDPQTYTAGVRLEIDNKDGLLRPNMFATAYINVNMGERLLIPESAVIFSEKKRIVFRDLGKGRLKHVEVETGLQNGDYIEVTSGLKEGDQIVKSGHFLIASESKLKSGLSQW